MRIFAIGDLHLAGGTGKTMDRFGDHWRDHDQKIFDAWNRTVDPADVVLVVGDSSWAMRIDGALPDLERIGNAPGTKLLVKGNHDYWWQTRSKMIRTLHSSIKPLNAETLILNRVAFAGTRGWLCPNDSHFEESDSKIYEREVERLRTALLSMSNRSDEFDALVVALHYPPTNMSHEKSGFVELIDDFKADVCVYGHLHGEDIKSALIGRHGATSYHLVSADAAGFAPVEIPLPSRES